MEFTLSVHQRLLQFFWLFNYPCRIFLAHAVQDSHHLFHISLVHRFDRTGIFWIRIFDKIKLIIAVLPVQGITRFHVFQFHGSTNITGLQFFHFHTVATGYDINLCNAFFRTAIRIQQVVSFAHFTTHYFKVGNFTDMRFYTCLEEIERFRTVNIRSHFFTFRILYFRHFGNKRNNISQKFH